MKKNLLIYLSILAIQVYSQTKIIFTSIDYTNDEVRATICDGDGSNRIELGFNKTYLPAWFNDKILLNSDTFIWRCDTSGANLTKLFPGYRVSVSNNKKMFAFYDRDGIGISDESGKVTKQIEVNTFKDAAITWSKNNDKVSFFNPENQICYLFNLTNDSLETFDDFVYHPLWNPRKDQLLFNRALSDGKYAVVLRSYEVGAEIIINKNNENAVVPIWSNAGDKIAYLSFQIVLENLPETDIYACDLVLYDVGKKTTQILSTKAGFTDKAFPQMCFDEQDEFIYFTKINEVGLGSIARVNIKTLQQETISKNSNIDERFPQVKSFK